MTTEFPLSLKDLRLALGLSQDQMAGLLQTTRSQVSMAELGLRPIGVPALLRIDKINRLLMQTQEASSENSSLASQKFDWLQRLVVEHHHLKKRIQSLKSGKVGLELLSVVLSHLEAWQSPDFNPEKDRLWKEMMEAAQPLPEETEWEIFRLSLELVALEWKISRLEV